MNNGMRTGVISFTFFHSRTTRASHSPRFHLCSPKLRKNSRLFYRLREQRLFFDVGVEASSDEPAKSTTLGMYLSPSSGEKSVSQDSYCRTRESRVCIKDTDKNELVSVHPLKN